MGPCGGRSGPARTSRIELLIPTISPHEIDLGPLKQMIDLTCDDEDDSESDDSNHIKLSRRARYRVTLISFFPDRLLPGR